MYTKIEISEFSSADQKFAPKKLGGVQLEIQTLHSSAILPPNPTRSRVYYLKKYPDSESFPSPSMKKSVKS